MSFREIMKKADMAKKFSIAEHDTVYFEVLLKEYPKDGMVHLRLGETYEALNDIENAAKEYKLAASLFPMPQWRNNAEVSLQRLGVEKKNMPNKKKESLEELMEQNNKDVIF